MFSEVPSFVPGRQPIPFPVGTTTKTRMATWALYVNYKLNRSWLAYSTPKGTKITLLGGIRSVQYDLSGLDGYVKQMQLSQCGDCD